MGDPDALNAAAFVVASNAVLAVVVFQGLAANVDGIASMLEWMWGRGRWTVD
jgi:hypothetical protein